MSSKIEQCIEDIEDFLQNCKPKFMSSSEIIVNKEELEALLEQLKSKTPEEIRHYQRIIQNKEAILSDAKAKAKALIDEATAQTNELINEHEIMQRAYAQASEVVTLASRQAQEILDNAAIEANGYREAAMKYMDDCLANLETILVSAIQTSSAQYEGLIGSLAQYRDVVQANRSQLYSADEAEDAAADPLDIDAE